MGFNIYKSDRGSFLIRRRTPWSPKDRDRNVDSDIPGKALLVHTEPIRLVSAACPSCSVYALPLNGDETVDLMNTTSVLEGIHQLKAPGCGGGIDVLEHFEETELEAVLPLDFHGQVAEHEEPPV